jgi:uncharacterized paraquat-inducible protein A
VTKRQRNFLANLIMFLVIGIPLIAIFVFVSIHEENECEAAGGSIVKTGNSIGESICVDPNGKILVIK